MKKSCNFPWTVNACISCHETNFIVDILTIQKSYIIISLSVSFFSIYIFVTHHHTNTIIFFCSLFSWLIQLVPATHMYMQFLNFNINQLVIANISSYIISVIKYNLEHKKKTQLIEFKCKDNFQITTNENRLWRNETVHGRIIFTYWYKLHNMTCWQ